MKHKKLLSSSLFVENAVCQMQIFLTDLIFRIFFYILFTMLDIQKLYFILFYSSIFEVDLYVYLTYCPILWGGFARRPVDPGVVRARRETTATLAFQEGACEL